MTGYFSKSIAIADIVRTLIFQIKTDQIGNEIIHIDHIFKPSYQNDIQKQCEQKRRHEENENQPLVLKPIKVTSPFASSIVCFQILFIVQLKPI